MSRLYSIGGKKYPSVTTILSMVAKPGIGIWVRNLSLSWMKKNLVSTFENDTALDVIEKTIRNPEWMNNLIESAKGYPTECTTKSATLGTKAHAAFEDLCCGKEVHADTELLPLVEGFTKWKATEPDLHIIEVETVLHSDKYRYAGTVDAIGVRTKGENAGIVILDWKTSNNIYPEYAWQASAYAKAYEEMTGQPGSVVEAQVVRFDKKQSKFEAKKINSIDESFEAFLACLALYNSKKKVFYKD